MISATHSLQQTNPAFDEVYKTIECRIRVAHICDCVCCPLRAISLCHALACKNHYNKIAPSEVKGCTGFVWTWYGNGCTCLAGDQHIYKNYQTAAERQIPVYLPDPPSAQTMRA